MGLISDMNPRNGSDHRGAGGSDSGDTGRMLLYGTEARARPSAWVRSLICLVALMMMVIDFRGGQDVSPWALYLAPVALAGWFDSRRVAVLLALALVSAVVVRAYVVGHPFESTEGLVVAMANRGVSLLAVALLISQLRLLNDRLNRLWTHEESRL